MYFLFFCFLYLFDTVDLPEKEAQYLWMIEYDYLHHCLLIDHAALIDRAEVSASARNTGNDQYDRCNDTHRLGGQQRRDQQSC